MGLEIEAIIEQQAVKIIPLVRARVPHDDFDDVMQDVRISFLCSLPAHRGEAALSTYAYAIAKHRIADYWKRVYHSKKVIRAMMGNYQTTIPRMPDREDGDTTMSLAEKEVFRLLGKGMNNEEIARTRFTSIDTVRTHLRHIYKKLGCNGHRDRAKVAVLANKIFTQEAT